MSEYQAERIKKPRYFKINSLAEKDGKERYVIGFDSEADTSSNGQPMLFQFSLPGQREEDTILRVIDEHKKHAGLRVFLDFIDTYCTSRDKQYLIYVWNLAYELTQIFHDLPNEIRAEDHLLITPETASGDRSYEWEIELLNVKRQILKFNKGKNISVMVLDGRAFYVTSLDKGAKMLGLGEKFASDELDRSMFTRDDLENPLFLKYARRDAFITRRIGEYIAMQHDTFRIPTTLSSPHLAATVFKTQFLDGNLAILNIALEQAGLYSYHGGKNGFYLDGPTDLPAVWLYDITSAYPEAMRQLPDIERSGWKQVRSYRGGTHSLYCVTGSYERCRYRGMQNHGGSWTAGGRVSNVWVTSYELDAMVQLGEFNIESISGYEMIGPEGGALQQYVDRFFLLKQTTTGPERETAKLLLNSLYGKFFQKQPVGAVGRYDLDNRRWITSNPDEDFDYEAGGLYHPPIASLITGFVRARIHRLEHKYEALMTSTDGLFALNPPDVTDLGSGLGQLKAIQGRLRIWRERLYIFDGNDGDRKYALHGFRNNVAQLEQIPLEHGTYRYFGKQMITMKQSTMKHDGVMYEPGTFVNLPYSLKI